MRKITGIVLAIFLGLNCQVTIAQDTYGASLLHFSQVLSYALENAPSITSAKATISTSEAQKLGAVAAFLPSLSVTDQPQIFHSYGGASNSVIGGVVIPAQNGYDANVTSVNLNINIYSGGQDMANYRASVDAFLSASLGLTATLDTLLEQLLTDFSAVCVDQITVQNLNRIMQINQDIVDLTSQRLQGRVSNLIDLIKVQQQVLQVETQLSQARQQTTIDFERLYADMGLAQPALGQLIQVWLPVAPEAVATGIQFAEDPAVQSAHATVLSTQEKVESARAGYYPTVAFTGQYNLLGLNSSSMSRAWNATSPSNYIAGILVTLPLLPFYNVKSTVDTALANVATAQSQYQSALSSSANRVADALAKFEEGQKSLKIATHSDELAQKNVQLVQDSYTAHQSDKIDVDNAKLLAEQANLSFTVAQINFKLAAWEVYRIAHPTEFPTTLLSTVAAVTKNSQGIDNFHKIMSQ